MQLKKQWDINNQEVIKTLRFLVGERYMTRKSDVIAIISESLKVPEHKILDVIKAEHDCHWGDIVCKILEAKNVVHKRGS